MGWPLNYFNIKTDKAKEIQRCHHSIWGLRINKHKLSAEMIIDLAEEENEIMLLMRHYVCMIAKKTLTFKKGLTFTGEK